METRLIERYYPDHDKTKFYLVEVHPSGWADDMLHPAPTKKENGVVFLELWSSDCWDEMLEYADEKEITLPLRELWVYPDWPSNIEIYV